MDSSWNLIFINWLKYLVRIVLFIICFHKHERNFFFTTGQGSRIFLYSFVQQFEKFFVVDISWKYHNIGVWQRLLFKMLKE